MANCLRTSRPVGQRARILGMALGIYLPTRYIQTPRSIGLASLYSSPSTHDPFDMLVVDSLRLKSLLGYCKYL